MSKALFQTYWRTAIRWGWSENLLGQAVVLKYCRRWGSNRCPLAWELGTLTLDQLDRSSKTCVKRFLNKVKPFCILLICNGLEKWREIVCYYLVVSRYERPVIFFRSLVGLLWTCRIKARPISFKDVHESCSLANLNSNAYIFRVGLFFVSWCPIS